jgi:hypothetical protein
MGCKGRGPHWVPDSVKPLGLSTAPAMVQGNQSGTVQLEQTKAFYLALQSKASRRALGTEQANQLAYFQKGLDLD